MNRLFCFLLFALSFGGCSSSGLKADLTKLRPWSPHLDNLQPLPPPFVVDYLAGAKSLTFLALGNGNDRDGPSLKLLRGVMAARSYGVVIMDGFPRSLGLSAASVLANAEKDMLSSREGYFRNGQTTAAVIEATKKKVPFVGAEPDEDLIKSVLGEAGYSAVDLFGFYLVREVPQWRRDGTLIRNSFEENYAEVRDTIGARVGLTGNQVPSYTDFLKWYKARNGRDFRPRDIQSETTAAFPFGALATQRIGAIADRIRHEHILRVTVEMLNRYNHVLLVFGASHYPVQQPALDFMLGKPARISDQP